MKSDRPHIGSFSRTFAAAALALAVLAAGCGKKNDATEHRGDAAAAPEQNAPSLAASGKSETALPARLGAGDVATVTRVDLTSGVPVSGTLRPAIEVHITSPFDEILEQVFVREGARVRKGQSLAKFRTVSLEPAAASDAAELKMRAADYERMQNLLKEGAVSQRDVESAEAAWRVAKAQNARATNALEDATVRAPFAGVIAKRSVQAGDRVSVGDPLFQLVNTAELEFEATVPSEYVRHVERGAPVSLTVRGFDRTVEGHVARVNATADEATRQVKVYVSVANADGALVGGLFASGAVVSQRANAVLAVPAGAVHDDGGKSFVMAVAGGRLARRDVTVGLRDESQDRVEIQAGLAEGDTVVTGTLEGLVAGREVTVAGGGR